MKKFIFMGVIGLFLLGSCNNAPGENHDGHNHDSENHNHKQEADHGHEGHDHESGENEVRGSDNDEIILPATKARTAGVETSIVTPGTFHRIIKTSGRIMAAQGDESVAVATVAGVVSFKGKVIEGMSVSKGTPLVVLSSGNMAEGDPVQKARIAYEVSKKEYERMKTLVSNKIVSEKEFAQAEQTYENARISYEAVAKNHSAAGQAVTSPIGGYIKSLLVKEGDYVNVGQPLVSITQNRKLFLRADVSEKYYPCLSTISSANFRTPYSNKTYTLEDLGGRMLSYGKASGENGYYIPVTFEFDNKGDIIPGAFVEVFLLSSPMENVISVPHGALTEEQGGFFVYLQLDEEGYKKQPVALGADSGERVQILAGVKAGDRVVTKGAYQVKLASASNAIPAHSHEH
ncbi:efflux RND transporter periplasmic adaptor subunit [Bacteroides helcogenes]|uniref:Efflux transporter, RND family, MFP subunit n=1 Tax=Bacteroides helcogenes (strain ATCC 35417 / DSM 20613 / JCM 6297 / CCUG 15421 / P 36-108) TaxID=693979 RepID=E6SSF9_BACT6|nr:efflux RND transporter periplasmic adaptor subunit [Bacteroides helcogenes]ADV45210.1 efflux transporter, RND family, MFP subunit [Bacteroides helcogenes P 36-108]MDY5238771.1 efflux RND transporter periplasmic adaptor subunit [Bacteroides helcogenes]